ncbi:hypothetical protein [Streptomyces sp. NPDC057250]|uniref:hypothetical protein n=1 Tax=Streptomyces sp. NPDC057250 TaxID=3346068 RepID=UPI00362E873F
MTLPRDTVTKALKAAGWTGTPARLSHPTGATLSQMSDAGDCDLECPGASTLDFTADTPDAVVLAASLAASGQLDPTRLPALEARAAWLGDLEAAGLDNWPGVDTARQIRRAREAGRR